MKRFYFYLILLLLPLSVVKSLSINNKKAFYQPEKLILQFDIDSVLLGNNTKNMIDSFITNIYIPYSGTSKSSIIYFGDTFYNYQKYDLVLSPKFCQSEYKKNKFIGVQRSVVIIDYIERKYKILRSKIYISDDHEYGNSINNECNIFGVYLGMLRSK